MLLEVITLILLVLLIGLQVSLWYGARQHAKKHTALVKMWDEYAASQGQFEEEHSKAHEGLQTTFEGLMEDLAKVLK